jgi:diaminopimelate epimerase
MRLRFTKMHGAGNDFIVLDGRPGMPPLTTAQLARLCHRSFGIGCDQLLVVGTARDAAEDYSFRIFNQDGSEARQCGNGLRCVVRWLADRDLLKGSRVRIGALGGVVAAELLADGQVRVAMGVPRFEPADVPFVAERRAERHALAVEGRTHEVGVVSIGNPHAVLRVARIEDAPVTTLGPLIEQHARFPKRANVGFMQRLDAERIRLRVWERGVGETLACGTGACAAVAWGRLAAELGPRVSVELPGGTLVIEWRGEGETLSMTGPATTVFTGEVEVSTP